MPDLAKVHKLLDEADEKTVQSGARPLLPLIEAVRELAGPKPQVARWYWVKVGNLPWTPMQRWNDAEFRAQSGVVHSISLDLIVGPEIPGPPG